MGHQEDKVIKTWAVENIVQAKLPLVTRTSRALCDSENQTDRGCITTFLGPHSLPPSWAPITLLTSDANVVKSSQFFHEAHLKTAKLSNKANNNK